MVDLSFGIAWLIVHVTISHVFSIVTHELTRQGQQELKLRCTVYDMGIKSLYY